MTSVEQTIAARERETIDFLAAFGADDAEFHDLSFEDWTKIWDAYCDRCCKNNKSKETADETP